MNDDIRDKWRIEEPSRGRLACLDDL